MGSANNTTQPSFPPQCNLGINNTVGNISYAIFMSLILIASVFGNSLVVASTYLSKQLRSRATSYFIVSLAISDMLLAIITIPFKISEMLYRREVKIAFCHSLTACYYYSSGDSLCTITAILTLYFIASDRFIAIRFPFKHNTLFTTRKTRFMICMIWIYAVLFTIAGMFMWDKRNPIDNSMNSINVSDELCRNFNSLYFIIAFSINYIPPVAAMAFMYLMILKTALSQIHAIESMQVQNCGNRMEMETINNNSETPTKYQNKPNAVAVNKDKKKRLRRRELKATKSVAIVYLAYVICWLPSCIIIFLSFFHMDEIDHLRRTNIPAFMFIYVFFGQVLPMLHTIINPIIYSFTNKHFQKSFWLIYQKIVSKNIPQKYVHGENQGATSQMSFTSRAGTMSYVQSEAN